MLMQSYEECMRLTAGTILIMYTIVLISECCAIKNIQIIHHFSNSISS